MKLSKRTKITLIFLGIIVILSTFLGVGYAQISAVDLTISGKATMKKQEGIMITSINYVSGTNVNQNLSTINDFYQTTMDSTIVLNNDLASTITYQVNIQNTLNEEYTFAGVIYDSNFYDNPSIVYEVTGINIGDKIEPNETKTLMIAFKYNGTSLLNSTLNSFLNFKFQKEEMTPVNNTQTSIEETGNLPIDKIASTEPVQEKVISEEKTNIVNQEDK